jgi:hypothetical protein
MAKPKKGGLKSSGPHKNHGPKRKLFKEFKPMIHTIAKTGVLSKYYNLESFMLACQARGLKSGGMAEWKNRFSFFTQDLKNRAEQNEWLRNCKHYKDPDPNKKKVEIKA